MTQKPGAYQPGKDHMQGLGVTEGLVTCRNHASSGQDSRLGYYYNTLHLDFLCIYSGFLVYGSKLLRHGRGVEREAGSVVFVCQPKSLKITFSHSIYYK